METTGKALIVDDEEGLRYTFGKFLEGAGWRVDSAGSGAEARALLPGDYDVLFVDILLGENSGMDFLREARDEGVHCPVVMITGSPAFETAAEAVRLGAFDYIQKPIKKETLLRVAAMALRYKRVQDEADQYRTNLDAMFRSIRDAVITTDSNGALTAFNDAARSFCFFESVQIGRPLVEAEMPCAAECVGALRQAIEHQEPVELFRVECKHRNRPLQTVNISAVPLVSRKGDLQGGMLVIRNKTRDASLEASQQPDQFHSMIGSSAAMRKVYSLIGDVADINTTVLITGESGTGKELVAEALHHLGVRKDKPLVKINCSALQDELLASELFGHVKGAFTGAIRDKTGRFQLADQGTVFLDEIGDISARMQLHLLRFLQEREFERVGDARTIRVNVRVIAATNQDLLGRVRSGMFREDLYYRLHVVNIHLPPLRKRREDIPLLVRHFLDLYNKRFGKSIAGLSDDAMKLLMVHPWPGNVRQFAHMLESACALCRENVISTGFFEDLILDDAGMGNGTATSPSAVSAESATEDPCAALHAALEKTGGNKAKAARILGISRQTFYRKLAECDYDQHDSKE